MGYVKGSYNVEGGIKNYNHQFLKCYFREVVENLGIRKDPN